MSPRLLKDRGEPVVLFKLLLSVPMETKRRKNTNKELATTSYSPVRNIIDDFFTLPSVFDSLINRSIMPSYNTLMADVWEEGDNYFVKMAMPGISKKDITIELDGDTVRIRGEKKEEEKEEGKKKYYFRSLESQFEQVFNLPTVIDADKAEASVKDGVLLIKLPKAKEYMPKKVEIKE
jgi:HSP20 family molecular chaperone IbpA